METTKEIKFIGEDGEDVSLDFLDDNSIIEIFLGLDENSIKRLCVASSKFDEVLCANRDFWVMKDIIDSRDKHHIQTPRSLEIPDYTDEDIFVKKLKRIGGKQLYNLHLENKSVKEIILWVAKNGRKIHPPEKAKLREVAETIDPNEKIIIALYNSYHETNFLYLVSNFGRTFFITLRSGTGFPDVRYNFFDFWLPKDYFKIIVGMIECINMDHAGHEVIGFELNRISDVLNHIKNTLYEI